jgi:hypothetical protein
MQAAIPVPRTSVALASDTFRSLLRVGAGALILAGLMALPVLLSVNPPTDPAQNREWAIQANSDGYRLAWTLRVYSVVPLLVGIIAVFVALADSDARRTALAGMLVTVVAGGVLLAGMAYPVIVMPAAGVLIAAGHEAPILRLLEQIFREPAWIPIFFAGLIYNVGWIVMGLAIRRSPVFPRFTGEVVIALGVIGIPAFLDVTVLGLGAAILQAVAAALLAVGLWRRAATAFDVGAA